VQIEVVGDYYDFIHFFMIKKWIKSDILNN
jgi:hypothetical protein